MDIKEKNKLIKENMLKIKKLKKINAKKFTVDNLINYIKTIKENKELIIKLTHSSLEIKNKNLQGRKKLLTEKRLLKQELLNEQTIKSPIEKITHFFQKLIAKKMDQKVHEKIKNLDEEIYGDL